MEWFVIYRRSTLTNQWRIKAIFSVHIDGESYLELMSTLDPLGEYKSELEAEPVLP